MMKDIPEIQNLSVPERLALVSAIWNSLFHDLEQLPLSQGLRDELDRELEEHHRDPASSQQWEDADREIFGAE